MNLRKGFFRLTLVLSIIAGIIPPLCHEWFLGKSEKIEVALPQSLESKSLNEKLDWIDDFLSHKAAFFLLSKAKQINMKRQLKEQIINEEKKKDEWSKYRVYVVSSNGGWVELGFLAIVGFAFTWLVYFFIRWVIWAFIVEGFKNKATSKGGNEDYG